MNERTTVAGGEWHWKHLLLGGLLIAWSLLITQEAWRDLAAIARGDEESSHILLVPIAVAWLVWVRRGRLRQCRPGPSLLGVVILAAGWLLWSLGFRRNIQAFWHAGAVTMAVGAFVTMAGRDVVFRFMPAFATLAFLIPVPYTGRQMLAIPLQTATAQVTQSVLEVLGVTVSRTGNLLSINGHGVAIAEACNGMRMVFTLMMVCYIFAFTTPLKGYVRFLILVLSPLTAIVCNVIRLVPTVWMYGYTSNHAASVFHDVTGWVMLGVAFLLLTSVVSILRWAMIPITTYTLASR